MKVTRNIAHQMFAKLIFGAVFLAVFFCAYCALLYLRQDDLIFVRVRNDPQLARSWQARRVEIPADGTVIEGWWADNPRLPSGPVAIYFGGNGEDVLRTAENVQQFSVSRMLLTNYRGYGNTPGKPSERALFSDALAIYDYAVKQPGVSAPSILIAGRSLGSGVAIFLAAHRSVCGVVLVTPYDSMVAVAQERYPWVPVGLLLRNQFPSERFAPAIFAPVTIIAAEHDRVIVPHHAHRLHAVWAGAKQIHILEGMGHNDIQGHVRYYPLINSFLDHVCRPSSGATLSSPIG